MGLRSVLLSSVAGGWPMESPNPNARNAETARKLVAASYGLVRLERE